MVSPVIEDRNDHSSRQILKHYCCVLYFLSHSIKKIIFRFLPILMFFFVRRAYYEELSTVMFVWACCTFVFTPISLYRLGPMLTFAFVIITLHHLITPWFMRSSLSEPSSLVSPLEIDESQSQQTEVTESSTTPDDEIDFKAIAETLGSISERTEEITDDPSPTVSSNQSESDKDIELISNSKLDNGKLTPSTDSEPELSSSNGSVSSFENLSTTELLQRNNEEDIDNDNNDNVNCDKKKKE